jgi:methionyl-tRNA formyltransferase
MLPEVVWKMPPLGTFNLHASLLPQYRGAAPVNWAVINGETETGVTTFMLSHEIDTGSILFNEIIPVRESETAGDIHDRLMFAGAKLVLKTVDALARQTIEPIPQERLINADAKIRHAPKIFRSDMRIDWNKPARAVYNLIRGLSPYPGAWTLLKEENGNSTEMKIYFAEITNGNPSPSGTISCDGKNYIHVACGQGWLSVTDLQIAGKKRMTTIEFLRGFQVLESGRFSFA